ncbi:MipA/OmpV family protein [Rubrivivax gelatinosus]|uniref:Outer membrane scaffolding protein for murein synthesis (MipA/OmpV family) n=1 Tax=Rubrivivax gelatinosus (strain NBRC 100245 / IL144) TaxID=983917 RepID=I0HW09_RUBGI|nr:MipA/OmpV family protein [Rubrivivax gelatinosus]BAL97196.1 hypothetical protein RGE_38570 [Rubrivivax gelatinosus IL144]
MKPLAALLLAAAVVPAAAEPLWELGAGATVLRLPHYRGAADSSTWVLPLPWFVYRGEVLRADRDGARARLFETERVDLDLGFAAGTPTRSDDDEARRGMDDLEPTVEVGPRLRVALAKGADWKTELRLPLRAVIGVDRSPSLLGWTAAPALAVDGERAGFGWGLQAGPIWGDRRLHRHYYEVRPDEAAPGRPAYAARGGYAGWQATAALSRRAGPWWFAAFVRADSVGGAVFADSPLVRRDTNVGAGIALVRVFARSEREAAESR